MNVAERFGANLKRERERADLSQEALSLMACVHRTEVSMLERGIRIPRIDTLVKLACSLEVTPEELLAGLDWEPGEARIGRFEIRDEAKT